MAKLPGWRGRGGPAPLGEFLAELVAPALARQGLGETSLITDWTEIVGAHIAKSCRPIEVQWPPRAARRDPDAPIQPATLILRVEGAFALEAQHSVAAIIERVNAHLGWRCIGKVAFRQGPLDSVARQAPCCQRRRRRARGRRSWLRAICRADRGRGSSRGADAAWRAGDRQERRAIGALPGLSRSAAEISAAGRAPP